MQKQQQLFLEKDTLVSIDPQKNRYRGYQIEMTKTKPQTITTKWGRVEEDKKGNWKLKKNKWLGTKEIHLEEQELDEFYSEDVYRQILEQKRRRGYVDYSELVV